MGIEKLRENAAGMPNGVKAMILAAGLGTRLKPWTNRHPKALALVNGKSLLQHKVEYLQQFGINDIIVNVHHFANQIIKQVKENDGWGSHITISDESAEVLETGGGFLKARPLLQNSSLIVLTNVDVLTSLDLISIINYHCHQHPLATLATTTRATSRYFLFNKQNTLCGWRNIKTGQEKTVVPTPDFMDQRAFSGLHIINPSIFDYIERTGKFSMVDIYLDLMASFTIKSFDHSQDRFIDVGRPESIAEAERLFPA